MASSSSSSSSMLHFSMSRSSPDRAASSSSCRIFSVNQYAGTEVDIIRHHDILGDGGRDQGDGDDESFKLQGTFPHLSSSKDQNHTELKIFPVRSEDEVTIEVKNMDFDRKHALLQRILPLPQEDNEQLLLKLRERIDKVGIDIPKIEVRFEHLNIGADIYVGKRALPTLLNFTLNTIQGIFDYLHVAPSRNQTFTILHDISGIIKPSRMTLLLGPPGSGKTTLLLALAGKANSDLRVSGQITYNGCELREFVPQRTAAYISQNDLQIGEMTVRETLEFCSRCQGSGSRYEMLMQLLQREKEAGIKPDPDIDMFMKGIAAQGAESSLLTDYIMRILGLDMCADILVGNEMVRGISGGQKKRVTTGEMLVGPSKAFFMDEISTGLDSSTTFQILKCLQQSVHVMDTTMFISLLQPAPETFELFDDIILLSEGQILYQGPRESVLDFFEFMGFKCPERKGVADFLQEVTSRKDQQQYWADNKPYRYIPVFEFAQSFSKFYLGQRVSLELSVPYDKSRNHPASLAKEKYGLSRWELLAACFSREWLLMKRNSFLYIFKTLQISFMAMVTMTVFLRTTLHHNTINDGNIYLGAIFFAICNVLFNGFVELSLTVFRLPVFYKQRDMLMYPAWAFSLPTLVMRIPLSLLESGIWVILTYYGIGFAPDAERFFRQFLVLFLIHQMALGLFRTIAAVGRDMVVSSTFGTFILVVVFVCGGFVVSRDNIPVWCIWGFWSSPLTYGQNAMAVNEFLAPRWATPNPDPRINARTVGQTVLKSRGMFAVSYWYWIGIGALCGYIVFFHLLFTLALIYLNPLDKPRPLLSEEALEEKHAYWTGEVKVNKKTQLPLDLSQGNGIRINESSLSISAESLEADLRHSNAIHEPDNAAAQKGMILPFQPLSMAFENINYYVDMPTEMKKHGVNEGRLQLLRNVCGAFKPGILTALVGISGAGKTTLMDVLAGRKTGGYIEGTISISGYPKKQETFTRISGYCEQNDIHSPNVTVEESLMYSAWLRLAQEVESQTRKIFVDEVMELVELSVIKDAIVGQSGINGLSTEQRKRLTIAVELVANPSILFMDEPTSGLDARAAAIVMRTVRNTVNTGRTVVCTIHQPSIDIFEAFDELLLMKRGGQVVYSGPLGHHSQNLIQYFENIPAVPKIKDGYNPATWMLEISSEAMEAHLDVNFAHFFENSSLFEQNKALLKELSYPGPDTRDIQFPTRYAQSFWVQCLACLWKQHLSYWRNPYYSVVRFFFTTITAFIFGAIYWNRGKKTGTLQDLFNILGGMYAAVLFVGVNNSSSVQPVVGVERSVFYRERAAGMYSEMSYAFAQAAIEVPYALVQTVFYVLILYSMVHFDWRPEKFFWFFFFTFFSFLYFTYYGMMCVSLTPNHHFAAIVTSACYALWNLFSGFLIPLTAIPIWWRWYYWATPVSWTLYGIISSQLGDVNDMVLVPGQGERVVSEYITEYFGFRTDFLGLVAVMHVVFVAVFVVVFAYGIKNINFQKR